MKHSPEILVTVVDDPASPKCEARCGLDVSSPETFKSTAEVLRKLFGGKARLEYTTLDAARSGPLAAIAERVTAGELSLPLLLINGKPRVSGCFDLHLIQESIQMEIEMAAE